MKKIASILIILIYFFCAALPVAQADFGINYGVNLGIGGEDSDPRDVAVNIVKIMLTFVGIIAVSVFIIGLLMLGTGGAKEETAQKAKGLIASAIIGMILIMSSFMITSWVFRQSNNIMNP